MGRLREMGRNYTSWDLLLLAARSIGENLVKKVDTKGNKKKWEGMSDEKKRSILDEGMWDSFAGVGGGIAQKLSGPMRKSATVLKHAMEDKTLRAAGKELGIGTEGVQDVSGKIVREMGEQVGSQAGWMRKIKKMFLSAAPLSPETVYALEKTGAGRKIYRIMDLADQSMNRFMVGEVDKFMQSLGKIKAGSVSSRRVGRVLDGKLDVGQLSKEETKLYKFLSKKFDFLINKYARSSLGTDARYKKIASAASADKSPMVGVKDLGKGLKSRYDKQVGQLARWLGGRSLDKLTVKDKTILKKMRGELDSIKHKGWLEGLDQTEREVYSLMKRKVKNYLPHIFDREELLKGLESEKVVLNTALGKAVDGKEINRIKRRLISVEGSVNKLKGGGMVTYEHLPQNLRFKFFDTRQGAQGYSFDSVKAYESYLKGISKKIYQEPAVQQVKTHFNELSPEYRQYVTKHVKTWLGMGRTGAMDAADAIASVQWMLKLGLNPRSAITNFAQRVNTIADVGEGNAIKGYFKGWTKEGDELFKKTGLAQEVPTVLMEGKVPEGMEKFRTAVGFMFSKIEIGNRKGAFLAGVEQAQGLGLTGQEAIQHGIDVVHKTQFRYGSIGLPMPLQSAPGKLAMQFWSYPIKQTEFLVKLLKNDPGKLVKWAIYAEGGRELLEETAGIDMGNAMGLGFNWGELVSAAKQVPEGDWDNFFKHIRLANSGGGLVPGYSPTVGAVVDIAEGIGKGRGLEALGKELVPVQAKKMKKLYEGVRGAHRDGEGGYKLPWYDSAGRLDAELSPMEAGVETFGPRLERLSEVNLGKSREYETQQHEGNLRRDLSTAIRKGDWDTVEEVGMKLMDFGDIGARMQERNVPWKDRHEMDLDIVREELLK